MIEKRLLQFRYLRYRELYMEKVIVINLLFSLWYITGNSVINLLFLAVLGMFIVTNTTVGDFYLFAGMIPFLKLVTYHGITILFVFQTVAMIKLVFEKRKLTISATSLFAAVLILATEFYFDYSYLSIGDFLYTICNFLYFISFINWFRVEKIESRYLLSSVIITSGMCLLLVAIVAGQKGMSLANYANASENYIRLGTETTNLIGAMGIPTYAGIVLSCVYVLLIKYKLPVLEVILCIGISLYSILLGFLSVSRGFILCLGVLIVLIVANTLFTRNKKKSAIIILTMAVIIIFYYYNNSDSVINMLSKMQSRMNGVNVTSNDNRSSIWKDCIKYLTSHPTAFLFGRGVNNYIAIGAKEGYRFSMSAHNLLLDGVMAWGCVGFGAFILSLCTFYKIMVRKGFGKVSFTYAIPFIVWFAMRMIGGAFTSFAMYMMILCFIIIAASDKEKIFDYGDKSNG